MFDFRKLSGILQQAVKWGEIIDEERQGKRNEPKKNKNYVALGWELGQGGLLNTHFVLKNIKLTLKSCYYTIWTKTYFSL